MKDKYFLLVLLAEGLLWLKSSYGKFSAGGFVENLVSTLIKFSANNPNSWYVNFLKTLAIPNATLIGMLVLYGELVVAVSLTLGSLVFLTQKKFDPVWRSILGVGLFGALILNLNFYFAAGWTSPSTESLNLLMATIDALGLWFVAYSV